jgi:hypothetical protein
MVFDNVKLMSYSHQSRFLGGDSVLIGIVKTIEITGYILDLTNSRGVSKIVSDVRAIRTMLSQFQDIILNGQNFGRGKATSFSVDSGNWVRTTQYQATFEILQEIPLGGTSSGDFSSINLNGRKLHLLKDLTESFSIDFDKNNKILNGTHSIDLQFNGLNSNSDLLADASFLASILLSTLPGDFVESTYIYRTNSITSNSENYNLIDGRCGFVKTFTYNNEDTTKQYSVERENNISINIDGIVEVFENIRIKAEDRGDYETIIVNAIKTEKNTAYSRCLSLFNKYKTKLNLDATAFNLINIPREHTNTIDRFNGTGSLNIIFDNDKKRLETDFSIERSLTLSRTEEYIWTVSETGSVTGKGKIGSAERYQRAQNGWATQVKPGIENRVSTFYYTASDQTSGTPIFIRKTVSKNQYNGLINYTYEYSDDPKINLDGKKITISRNDTGLPPIFKDFVVPNNTYVLKQNMGYVNMGTHTVTVELNAGCDNSTQQSQSFNGFSYFNEMRSLAILDRSKFGGGTEKDPYLEGIKFTSDEVEKRLTLEATYKYS